jgi:hypothetical protein
MDTGSFEQARAGLPDISPDVSVIWKPLQRLFQDGNPIEPVTILYYNIDDVKYLPFAAIAKTKGKRLILWPPWDTHGHSEFADGHTFRIDHATLELQSGKTHLTCFDANGQRIHEDCGWKLTSFEDGLRLWLICAFHVNLLEEQVGALEQEVKMPTSDSKRRLNEFRRYAAQMSRVPVNTPPLRGDCFVTVIHLPPESSSFRSPVKPTHFPMGSFWNDWIDGWTDGDNFQIFPKDINVGGVNLLLLTASPLGRLKGASFLGSGR